MKFCHKFKIETKMINQKIYVLKIRQNFNQLKQVMLSKKELGNQIRS